MLRIFGTEAYAHIPKERRGKLDVKSENMILVGFEPNGYRLFDPKKKNVVRINDVIFLENEAKRVEISFLVQPIDEHYVHHKAKGDSIPKTFIDAIESNVSNSHG